MAANEDQKKALTRAVEIIEFAYQHAQKKFQERQYYNNMYHNFDEVLKEKQWWQTKFAHPFPFFTIEMKSAFYREGIFGTDNKDLWTVHPENPAAHESARVSSKLINYQLGRSDFDDEFDMATKDLGKHGDLFLEVFWNRKEKYVQMPDKFKLTLDGNIERETYNQIDPGTPTYPVSVSDGQGGVKVVRVPGQSRYVLEKNQPDVRTVYINSVWPDPKATSLKTARYVVVRDEIPFQDLKRREENGEFVNVDMLIGTDMTKMHSSFYDNENYQPNVKNSNSQRISGDSPIDKENQLVSVERIIYTDTGEQEIIGNRSVYMGRIKPFWLLDNPIEHIRNFPESGKFWGQSDFRAIAAHWRLVNQYQNLEADNILMHHRGYTVVTRDAGPNAQHGMENLRPGSIIVTNNAGAISHNQPPLFNPLVLQAKQDLINQAQQPMGLNEILAGGTPSSNVRSGDQFSQMAAFGAKLLNQGVKNIQRSLSNVGTKFVLLNQQFMDMDQKVAILGEDAMEELFIAEDTFPLNPHITVKLSSDIESKKDAQLQQLLQAINLAAQAPGTVTTEMVKDWLKIQGKFDKPEKYFAMSPEESVNFTRASIGLPPFSPAGVPQLPPQGPDQGGGQEPSLAGATRAPSANQVTQGNNNGGTANIPTL